MFSSCFDARGKLTRHTLTRECHKPNRRTTERRKEINITMSDVWTTKLRATRQLLNELRADAANGFSAEDAHGNTKASTSNHSSSADADRARRVAVTRRKLNRLDDLLDVLEDCVGEGAENDEDIRAREETVNAFQREARELRGALNREPTISAANANDRGGHAAKSTTSANVQAFGAVIGKSVSSAATTVGNVAGDFVASASRAAEKVPGLDRAATMVMPKMQDGNREGKETRSMDTVDLIQHQSEQMREQDDALDDLDALVGSLKVTSEAIHDEVALQARLVEDLEADFSHTSDRMRKLRKQGFKLAGEKNEEERERLDRKEVIEEMRAKLQPPEEESACVIQ